LWTKSEFLKSIITIGHLRLKKAYILTKSIIFYVFFSHLIIRFFLCLFQGVVMLFANSHIRTFHAWTGGDRDLALVIASCKFVCVCVCVCVCVHARACETGGGVLFRINWPNFAKLCIKVIVVTDANMTYALIF
jgi:hypothetical protein